MNNEIEEKAWKTFGIWKESLDYELGDAEEDWKEWWECFLAGFKFGILSEIAKE